MLCESSIIIEIKLPLAERLVPLGCGCSVLDARENVVC